MFMHVRVGTDDIQASTAFYDAVLAVLGYQNSTPGNPQMSVYRSEHGIFVVGPPANSEPVSSGNGGTIGFKAVSSTQVDAFYAAGMAHGGTDEGKPGKRSMAKSYGAYLRDPAGHKVCAFSFDQA